VAVPLEGEERDRFYKLQGDLVPAYAEYQAGTSRTIPVIALYRADYKDPARNRAIGEELLRVHAQLRRDLAAVRHEVGEFLAGRAPAPRPAQPFGEELRAHCLTFCDALATHHTREDGAFSGIEEQFPHLAPALDRLRREHRVVAEALKDLRTLLSELDTTGNAKIQAELDRLASDLEEHFAYEERQLLPVLNPA
jgi:iron-sulfur cluster repair protein YtfE (RIC family)